MVFRDEDITRLQPHMRTRRGIARSFQIPRPFKSMTVAENLMVALDFAAVTDELASAGPRSLAKWNCARWNSPARWRRAQNS